VIEQLGDHIAGRRNSSGGNSMSTEQNLQIVKDFFAAMGSGDKQGLLALTAEDIEWIIPGEHWPLAGTHCGHTGLAELLQKASKELETSFPEPPEFVAQGDRVLVVGFAKGKSRPRIRRSKTVGSSPSPFETAR
jgi:uncharacterized protein